jgi:hypothetical protein
LPLRIRPVLAPDCFLVNFPSRGFRQVAHDLDRLGGLVRSTR